MKNSQTTYKRIKNHWWILSILWGFYVWTIFAYIHQWGNNPIDKAGHTIFGIVWIVSSVLVFIERFTLTIDDNFSSSNSGRIVGILKSILHKSKT